MISFYVQLSLDTDKKKTLRISVCNISQDDSVRDKSVDQQQFSLKYRTTTNLPDTNGDSIALLQVLEKQEIYGEISQENGWAAQKKKSQKTNPEI